MVDTDKECFLPDPVDPDKRFPVFNIRGNHLLWYIFHHFVPNLLLSDMINSFPDKDLMLGGANKSGNPRLIKPTVGEVYQLLAIQIYIIGIQNVPLENECNSTPLRDSINNARLSLVGGENNLNTIIGIDKASKLNAIVNFQDFEYNISLNFQSFLRNLGEGVAGDE